MSTGSSSALSTGLPSRPSNCWPRICSLGTISLRRRPTARPEPGPHLAVGATSGQSHERLTYSPDDVWRQIPGVSPCHNSPCSATWPTFATGWQRPAISLTTPSPPPSSWPIGWASRCWSRGRRAPERPSWPRPSRTATGSELVRLQCYEGLDEARALYEWNYKKEPPRIQASGGDADWADTHDDIFSEEFLLSRPLLTAIRARTPPCCCGRDGQG